MRVIAVRRGQDGPDADTGAHDSGWVVSPGPETRLHAGDVLIAKGTRDGADRLAALAADG
jgi:uncharacterized protein with PhoU and TrkA domain